MKWDNIKHIIKIKNYLCKTRRKALLALLLVFLVSQYHTGKWGEKKCYSKEAIQKNQNTWVIFSVLIVEHWCATHITDPPAFWGTAQIIL